MRVLLESQSKTSKHPGQSVHGGLLPSLAQCYAFASYSLWFSKNHERAPS